MWEHQQPSNIARQQLIITNNQYSQSLLLVNNLRLMAFRVLRRGLCYIRKYEKYQEFAKVSLKDSVKTFPNAPVYSKGEHYLTAREDQVEEREFFTESDDFDPDTFSLRDYFWECVYPHRKITMFKLIYCFMFWQTIVFLSVSCFNLWRILWERISPLGYFGMLGPAFVDMNLVKYQHRLKFKKLHSFD